MGFLLSLNLSHWIGSFSTVGLDSHLGFRQKGLREAFHIHSWEKSEEKRELRGGTNFKELGIYRQHEIRGREVQIWHASQASRTVRFEGHGFRVKAGHRKRGWLIYWGRTLHEFRGRTQAVQHRNRGPYSLYGQYFSTQISRWISGTFPKAASVFVGTEIEAVQQH